MGKDNAKARVVPQELWGKPPKSADMLVPGQEGLDHVVLYPFFVPEGLVCLALCRECGGRCEVLYPLGNDRDDGTSIVPGEASVTFQTWWALEHGQCKTAAKQYVVPKSLADILDAAIRAHTTGIAEGKTGFYLHLVSRNRTGRITVEVTDLSDLPDDMDKCRVAIHAVLHGLRAEVDRGALDPIGAILIADGELARRGDEESRRDALGVLVVTADFGLVGLAEITRDAEGKGTPGALEWHPFVGRSLFIDGLLALPVPAKYDA